LSLKQYKGKYVVLFFYPLDFTFVCPTEIIAFGDRAAEFAAINTQVIAASCDSKFTHLAWVNTPRSEGGLGDMGIPILADFNKKVATDYGVLIPSGGDAGVPLRGLFIIDPKGDLRQITVNDLPVGRNVDEIIRLVKAFQFVEEHGEVCPANWTPGDLTMSADPEKSKAYFAKANAGASAASGASTVENVNDKATFAKVVGGSGLTVVDYWAPWCGNCKKISPSFDRLAAENPTIKFIKVNTNAGTEGEEIGIDQGVSALPTFQFFKGGKKVGEFLGSAAPALAEALNKYK
jgi:peroxiredoxin (alkyl hydroperoxide reductase subunit C)